MLKRQYLAEQEPLLRRSGVVSSSTTSPTSEEEMTNNPHDLTAEEKVTEKRLIRKLDLNLLLWAFLAYWANGLDRNNMPNAYTTGMKEDLDLHNAAYNWAVYMFFIGYVCLQIPCNAIMPKVRPRITLPLSVCLWGAMVSLMATVKTHAGLFGLRICLGFAEAPFYPGMIYLLGNWYTHQELGTRTAIFTAGHHFSGSFSGLISGAIAQTLDGVYGMRGWKWLFIVEGLMAVCICIIGFLVLPDYPHNTRFLSSEERHVAIKRLEVQGKKVMATGFNLTTLRNVFATPYVYLFIVIFICHHIGMGILQQFAIILREMGYDASFANYMTVPIYIVAVPIIILQGHLSDRYGKRHLHIEIAASFALVSYILLVVVNHGHVPVALLFACMYMVVPILGTVPIMMAWNNEIHQDDAETRALAIAIVNTIGSLASEFIKVAAWTVTQAPEYRTGKIVSTCTTALMIVISYVTYVLEEKQFMLPKGRIAL